jgi:hypothetical protein
MVVLSRYAISAIDRGHIDPLGIRLSVIGAQGQ